jgi:subtilisin-like proprotein convertase family protein
MSYNDIKIRLVPTYDASQLEIWVSSRQDSSYPYTDYKVWDRQPIGGSPFTFTIQATGFVNYHDWRLIVKDNAAGSTGTIDEFSININ